LNQAIQTADFGISEEPAQASDAPEMIFLWNARGTCGGYIGRHGERES
jgi:hypothetical protein